MLKVDKLKVNTRNMTSGITFTLEPGSIYGLIGHNGAGKTTILESMYCLNKYTGNISIDKEDISISKKRVAFLTGHIKETMKDPRQTRYLSILEDFDLDEFKRLLSKFLGDYSKKRALSRGQSRLYQIAVVLAFNKDIYLLDEPLAGLDFSSKAKVLEEIRSKSIDNKIVILSSHELEDINTSIDYAIFIKKGKLVKIADVDLIRQNEGLDLKNAYIKEYGGNIKND